MSYIYLATAYTHNDPKVRRDRYEQAARIVARYLESGHTLYSPVVHYHPLAEIYDLPPDYAFWSKHNLAMLSKASALWIFIPDSPLSVGVQAEYDFARSCGVPVFTLQTELSAPAFLTSALFD